MKTKKNKSMKWVGDAIQKELIDQLNVMRIFCMLTVFSIVIALVSPAIGFTLIGIFLMSVLTLYDTSRTLANIHKKLDKRNKL